MDDPNDKGPAPDHPSHSDRGRRAAAVILALVITGPVVILAVITGDARFPLYLTVFLPAAGAFVAAVLHAGWR